MREYGFYAFLFLSQHLFQLLHQYHFPDSQICSVGKSQTTTTSTTLVRARLELQTSIWTTINHHPSTQRREAGKRRRTTERADLPSNHSAEIMWNITTAGFFSHPSSLWHTLFSPSTNTRSCSLTFTGARTQNTHACWRTGEMCKCAHSVTQLTSRRRRGKRERRRMRKKNSWCALTD